MTGRRRHGKRRWKAFHSPLLLYSPTTHIPFSLSRHFSGGRWPGRQEKRLSLSAFLLLSCLLWKNTVGRKGGGCISILPGLEAFVLCLLLHTHCILYREGGRGGWAEACLLQEAGSGAGRVPVGRAMSLLSSLANLPHGRP